MAFVLAVSPRRGKRMRVIALFNAISDLHEDDLQGVLPLDQRTPLMEFGENDTFILQKTETLYRGHLQGRPAFYLQRVTLLLPHQQADCGAKAALFHKIVAHTPASLIQRQKFAAKNQNGSPQWGL
jgi:hypothetical protein